MNYYTSPAYNVVAGLQSVATVNADLHTQTVKVKPVSDGDASQSRRSPTLAGNERDGAGGSGTCTPGTRRRLTVSPARYNTGPECPQPEQLTVTVERVLTQVDVVERPIGGREQTSVDRSQPVVGQVEAAQGAQKPDVRRDRLESVAVEGEFTQRRDEQRPWR